MDVTDPISIEPDCSYRNEESSEISNRCSYTPRNILSLSNREALDNDCIHSDEEGIVYAMMEEEPLYEEESDEDGGDNNGGGPHRPNSRRGFLNPSCLGAHVPFPQKDEVHQEDFFLGGLAMSVRHNWKYVELLDYFKLMNITHDGVPLPSDKRQLWNALNRDESWITRHYLCRKCQFYLGADKTALRSCTCIERGQTVDERKIYHFYQVDLISQLREMLEDPHLNNLLQYRFTRKQQNVDAKEDFYDGDEFKKLCSPGNFLHDRRNHPLSLATDGAPTSDSSTTSAWPTFIQMPGFPPHCRKKYMLLASVYVGLHHPVMNNIMKPVMDQLEYLHDVGIEWIHPRTGEIVRSKFIVTTATVDLPARCLLTRMTYLNGRSACLYCHIQNESFVYALKNDLRDMRTEESIRHDMRQAYENYSNGVNENVRGFQGLSSLLLLPEFKISIGVVVDVMHCAYLGVMKQHTEHLLKDYRTKNRDGSNIEVQKPDYYVGAPADLKIIDSRLLAIRPPTRRSRVPRTIKTRADWKASEWRNWHDYAPVCLYGILPNRYLQHLAKLSQIIHLINNTSVTSEELDEAERLLQEYVHDYERYFGEKSMTPVVHLLTHIVDCVRHWGPIWTVSAFIYEAWNRHILEDVTSPNAIADQIVTRFLIARFLEKVARMDSTSEKMKRYIKELLNINDHQEPPQGVRFKVIQEDKNRSLTDVEQENLPLAYDIPDKVKSFQKVSINGINFERSDRKKTQHCDSVIHYGNNKYGKISSIVEFMSQGQRVRGLFVNAFDVERAAFGTRYIKKVRETRRLTFLTDFEKILPAFTMTIDEEIYAARLANTYETD